MEDDKGWDEDLDDIYLYGQDDLDQVYNDVKEDYGEGYFEGYEEGYCMGCEDGKWEVVDKY